MHLILDRLLLPKCSKNDSQTGRKKLGKFHFGRLGRPRAPPRTSKATHWAPRAPKMKHKAPLELQKYTPRVPEPPKRCPSDLKAPKMQPKTPPGHLRSRPKRAHAQTHKMAPQTRTHTHTDTQTHRHTHTHTHTQPNDLPTQPTTQIARPGGMREAIEYLKIS